VLRWITSPVRRFFNSRFVAIANSIEQLRLQVETVHQDASHRRMVEEAMAGDISRTVTKDIAATLDGQHQDLLGVASLLGRSLDQAVDAVALILERTDPDRASDAGHVASQVADALRPALTRTFEPDREGSVAQLDAYLASIVNYAESHIGWASQAGLWFNPPISIAHEPGGLRVADINERVAEVPFVYASIGKLALGSRILDVGATESSVAVGLASLGYRVTALDPRPYPLEHHNLSVHIGPVEAFADPDSFDGAVLLSSIEHFGLGAYDLPENSAADREAIQAVHRLLRPGGKMVLTTPYGAAPTTSLQRTYLPEHLDALLAEWQVDHRSYLTRVSRTEWRRVDQITELTGTHVVLIEATKR
jgi:SAM-dependent methyltransferase